MWPESTFQKMARWTPPKPPHRQSALLEQLFAEAARNRRLISQKSVVSSPIEMPSGTPMAPNRSEEPPPARTVFFSRARFWSRSALPIRGHTNRRLCPRRAEWAITQSPESHEEQLKKRLDRRWIYSQFSPSRGEGRFQEAVALRDRQDSLTSPAPDR